MQVDGRVSYGNDALMPDQTYSSAPIDSGLDGFGFIHPESFNQANTENHGNTSSELLIFLRIIYLISRGNCLKTIYIFFTFPQLSPWTLAQIRTADFLHVLVSGGAELLLLLLIISRIKSC